MGVGEKKVTCASSLLLALERKGIFSVSEINDSEFVTGSGLCVLMCVAHVGEMRLPRTVSELTLDSPFGFTPFWFALLSNFNPVNSFPISNPH